ncbi:MAG: hypothetical protein ACON5F_02280 [Jejuia sp.]
MHVLRIIREHVYANTNSDDRTKVKILGYSALYLETKEFLENLNEIVREAKTIDQYFDGLNKLCFRIIKDANKELITPKI